MKRRFRLTQSADFKRVRRLGKSFPHPLIVLVASPNDLPMTRFAVVAGRVVGKAVQRNRAKRIIRAALSDLLPDIKPGWDVILFARKPMEEASFRQTQEVIMHLLDRAQLRSTHTNHEPNR